MAQAAFASGTLYLTVRDTLGTFYQDDAFTALFPASGQPSLSPWRLAVVTIRQCRAPLSARQAAAAARWEREKAMRACMAALQGTA